jgi:CheY-like chemotaxis protein
VQSSPQHQLAGIRTLVVEDDPDIREGVVEFLEMEGAEVSTAETGDAGFDTFQRERPDLIVSDLWMPQGTGIDFIRRVRDLPPEQGGLTPAIAISSAESLRAALLAGFHIFIPKPFGASELIDTIADFAGPGRAGASPSWTVSVLEPGKILITHVGRVESADMRAMFDVVMVHLDQGPLEIAVDLRRNVSFAPSAISVVQRAAWSRRHRIRAIHFVGGSFVARVMAEASCKLLGIPCTFENAIEGGGRSEP